MMPIILIVAIYSSLRIEIDYYGTQLYADSMIELGGGDEAFTDRYQNYDLIRFKMTWILNYSLLFVSILAFVNMEKLKSRPLGFANLVLLILALGAFLTQGLFFLTELRENYLTQNLAEYYNIGWMHIGIRYISFAFVGLALFTCYRYTRQSFLKRDFKRHFDLLLHGVSLCIASNELIHLLDMAQIEQTDKLGLSILWGVYALFVIGLGIWKKKKHLRLGAIMLFGVTLIKLFFYDLTHLNTVSKTIVFVSLGALLLIISFLYNKYKHIISDEVPE